MEKTSHMMIDFADAFSTNVYQIGAIFLQLRVIFLENSGYGLMPLVDPGLYMVTPLLAIIVRPDLLTSWILEAIPLLLYQTQTESPKEWIETGL